MNNEKDHKLNFNFLLLLFIFPFLLLIFSEISLRALYKNKISPNVYLYEQNVSGLSKEDFRFLVDSKKSGADIVSVNIGDETYKIDLDALNLRIDPEKNWNFAYAAKKDYFKKPLSLTILSLNKKTDLLPIIDIDTDALNSELEKIRIVFTTPPLFERVTLTDGQIKIVSGKNGSDLDVERLRQDIIGSLYTQKPEVRVMTYPIETKLSEDEKASLIQKAEKLVGKSIIVTLEKDGFTVPDTELVELLNGGVVKNDTSFDLLTKKVSGLFEKAPKDSVFVFEGGRVSEFVPSEEGVQIDKDDFNKEFMASLEELITDDASSKNISLKYKNIPPKISTGDINNLGINEKVGSGYSTFKGSISSRIHNIRLASSKFNGVLISPGETISFNKTLGDVSKVTGYQPAYIIKDGQTILGDGGGVCQVSTTLFRAALNAGFPIIERRSHSYRVGYYEQGFPPGLDATVFDPSTDLKIKNDSEHYLLIQTIFNEKENMLTFDLYGSGDGRTITLGDPVITSSSAPPEDLYIDDPTLKAGVIKQIDYKAWGAKVYFNYKVKKNGSVLFEKTFYSNYQPWQAKFLRGTAL